jgi:hypothetical protein
VHEQYPQYWQVCRPMLEDAVRYVWEELSATGIKREMFYKKYRGALEMIGDAGDLKAAIACGMHYQQASVEIARLVQRGGVFEAMFKAEWLQVSRHEFIKEIELALRHLADHNFVESEYEATVAKLRRMSDDLVTLGHASFDCMKTDIMFLGAVIKTDIQTIWDEWVFRLHAYTTGVALNTEVMEYLPWESLACTPRHINNVPSVCLLPQHFLDDLLPAREAVFDILGPEPGTINDMIRVVQGKRGRITQLTRAFQIDIDFLIYKAKLMGIDRVQRAVLDTLPDGTPDPTQTITKALTAVAQTKHSTAVRTISGNIEEELSAVHDFIVNLSKSYAPKARAYDKPSNFFKLVLAKCLNFYSREVPSTSALFQSETLYGLDALDSLYARGEELAAAGTNNDPEVFRPLRVYAWAFDAAKRNTIDDWIRSACTSVKHALKDGVSGEKQDGQLVALDNLASWVKTKPKTMAEYDKSVVGGSASTSSSSSSGVKGNKKDVSGGGNGYTDHAPKDSSLLRFFVGQK